MCSPSQREANHGPTGGVQPAVRLGLNNGRGMEGDGGWSIKEAQPIPALVQLTVPSAKNQLRFPRQALLNAS